jgi:hypothetical protein
MSEKVTAPSKEAAILAYYRNLSTTPYDEYTAGAMDAVKDTLNLLGIKIEGVN